MTPIPPPGRGTGLPDVTTDRLTLRRFRADDGDLLAPVFAKREVWQYPFGRGFTAQETAVFVQLQIKEWDKHGFGCWVAIDRASEDAVGYVGLSVPTFLPQLLPAVEVGWRFDPHVWGRGYATEGAAAAIEHGFSTLGLDEICSLPQVDNPPSIRVAERLGMRRLGDIDVAADRIRPAVTVAHYVITPSDWHLHRTSRR